MSEQNVETVRDFWEAAMGGDPMDVDLSRVDADIVYEDEVLPDHGDEVYRGHAGLRRAWARMLEPWEDGAENVIEWARDAGDAVVTCQRARMKGKGSSIEVEFRYAYLWRLEDGRLVYLKSFRDPADALEAAGLSG